MGMPSLGSDRSCFAASEGIHQHSVLARVGNPLRLTYLLTRNDVYFIARGGFKAVVWCNYADLQRVVMPDTTDQFRRGVCNVRYARENLPYGPAPYALGCYDARQLNPLVVYLAEYLLAMRAFLPGFCIVFTGHFYRVIEALPPRTHHESASRSTGMVGCL